MVCQKNSRRDSKLLEGHAPLIRSRLPVRKEHLRRVPATQRALYAQCGRTGEIGAQTGRHASRLEAGAVRRVVLTLPRLPRPGT